MYGTLIGADQYHQARGNDAWTGDEPAKLAALARGSDYVDGRTRWQMKSGRWRSMFRGTRAGGRAQEREWPRVDATDYEGNVIPDDEVPIEVEHATYEAALRELAEPGSLSPDYIASQTAIREKVGPVEVQYSESKVAANTAPNRPVIPAIDEILAPLLFRPYELPGVVVV